MLRSLTNESSDSELDTLNFCQMTGSRRAGRRAAASGVNSGSQLELGGLL